MSDRLYIVNTVTKEHCCIAKSGGSFDTWGLGNVEILKAFLEKIDPFTPLELQTEGELEEGVNINIENKWEWH